MATVVETQRLITVSLGKIARSRAQRGGINLHKNLLVASVLNKARTAFMMENYTYQLSQQQQQQLQHKQQIVLSTPQPAPVSPSPATDSGNSLPSHVGKTCPTTPDSETRSAPIDTQTSSELVNGGESCALSTNSATTTTTADFNMNTVTELQCDKENVSPSSNDSNLPYSASFVAEIISEQPSNEPKQQCVSGEQHVEAANQLSHDAQLAGAPSQNNNASYITLLPCKQQSSATTTCAGVLKRRRVNPEATQTQISCESECPASKKARVSSTDSPSSSYSQNSHHTCDPIPSSCEYESSDNNCESDMQTSDSPQITNLVSIFNSGFSGLCNVSSSSSSSSSSLDFDNSCYQSDNSSSSPVSHSHHQSWSAPDNQSLHCSSMVERIGSISSAIVLSA